MSEVRTLILRAPGTNCDMETAYAFELAGSAVEFAHVNELLSREKVLSDHQILAIPGGFTYGDDISAGRILANEIRLRLGKEIERFVDDGKLILGICNGLQVLLKAGILQRDGDARQLMTVTANDSARFECRWVYLHVDPSTPCVFTRGISSMYLPVAHGEGRVFSEAGLAGGLNVALRYADEAGDTSAGYPDNPNGSQDNAAGICDASGRVFGLMPHPERHVRGTQHPRWNREPVPDRGDGLQVFVNAVEWAKGI